MGQDGGGEEEGGLRSARSGRGVDGGGGGFGGFGWGGPHFRGAWVVGDLVGKG